MSRKPVFALSLIVVAAVSGVPACAFAEENPAQLKADAVELIKEYAAALQGTLQGAMQSSGPLGALSTCHDRAPEIAAAVSQSSGWAVGRTSLKVRNPASAPDSYAEKVMTEFEQRIAKGEAVSDLVKAEVVDENGAKVFRFIKAIPTGEVCLTCHGIDVKPEIEAQLKALYPDDRATGYKAGDMRGVFTLSKRL